MSLSTPSKDITICLSENRRQVFRQASFCCRIIGSRKAKRIGLLYIRCGQNKSSQRLSKAGYACLKTYCGITRLRNDVKIIRARLSAVFAQNEPFMKRFPSTAFLLTTLAFACQQAWADSAVAAAAVAAGDPKPSDYVRVEQPKQTEAAEGKKLTPKYPVTVNVGDEEVKTMLEEHLPLITEQQQEDLDIEQIGFLLEDTPSDVQNMMRTQGYFNSQTQVQSSGKGYVVNVAQGKRTHIDNVSVAIIGDVLQDAELGSYYKNAMANWALPVGAPFQQDNWSQSKTSVLAAVARKKYPLARFTQTQANIDPNKNTADLNVVVDSQQPIYFGDIQISGTQRYPESVVSGLAPFKTGSPYDLDQLLDYQQALEQNSHFSGASVQADFANLQGDRVPVKVNVSEVKKHKLELGLRWDSEYGPGGKIGYDYYNLFNKGYVGSVVMDGDRYQTTLSAGISQPRNNNGHYWTSNVAYTRSTTQNLETKDLTSGVWFVRDRNNIEARLGVEYISGSRRIPSSNTDLGHSAVTMLTASWRHQDIETTLRPANGYYLDAKVGTTLGSLMSTTSVQRAYARAAYYFTPEKTEYGTFVVRGQLGYVYAKENNDVPASLLFRTGGATSVRGYELDSIGIAGPDDSVLPDRALAVASLEYQYPITKDFSAAIFHDMGDVSRNFKNMGFKHGTGVGVRWFSPVAPFSFDIAYGHNDKKIRWHISLGTQF